MLPAMCGSLTSRNSAGRFPASMRSMVVMDPCAIAMDQGGELRQRAIAHRKGLRPFRMKPLPSDAWVVRQASGPYPHPLPYNGYLPRRGTDDRTLQKCDGKNRCPDVNSTYGLELSASSVLRQPRGQGR